MISVEILNEILFIILMTIILRYALVTITDEIVNRSSMYVANILHLKMKWLSYGIISFLIGIIILLYISIYQLVVPTITFIYNDIIINKVFNINTYQTYLYIVKIISSVIIAYFSIQSIRLGMFLCIESCNDESLNKHIEESKKILNKEK